MTVKISVLNGVAFVDEVPAGVEVEITDYDVDPASYDRDERGQACSRYRVTAETLPEGRGMSETLVVNIHHRKPFDIYIGRPGKGQQSIWGNPFVLGKDGTREEVIAKYRAYILSRPDLLAQLPSLRGKRLGCFCAPRSCHGDVLVELLNRTQQYPASPTCACGVPGRRSGRSGTKQVEQNKEK